MTDDRLTIICGDALEKLRELPDCSVQCCVTSPPYWGLRDYGVDGQIGAEPTPRLYVTALLEIFREVNRALKDDGTLWLNLGDSYWGSGKGLNQDGTYSSVNKPTDKQFTNKGALKTKVGKYPDVACLKPKDLVGIPWMVAFALRSDGWWLRQDIIWSKPNPMPESVTDRCTKCHEYLFLLTKSSRYFYDAEAIKEVATCANLAGPNMTDTSETYGQQNGGNSGLRDLRQRRRESKRRGEFNGKTEALEGRNAFRAVTEYRNKRSVWTVTTQVYPESHFATYPPDLIKPCILAGSRVGDTILDPFGGSGTTGMVALELGRKALLIELNESYCELAKRRCHVTPGLALA